MAARFGQDTRSDMSGYFTRFLQRLCFCGGCSVLSVNALAQTDVLHRDTLHSVSVVARRGVASLSSATPGWRLDTATLRRRGVTDMAGALRRLAGVQLRDYGGAGALKTVSVRGLGAAHTVVSYDGLPVSDVRQGQIDLSRFSLDRLRGLQLAVADRPDLLCPVRSLGAVSLDLLSFRPQPGGGLQGEASVVQGAFGLVNPALRLSLPVDGRTTVGLGGDYRYMDNSYPFVLKNGVLETKERREHSCQQTWTAEADVVSRLADGGLWQSKVYYRNNAQQLPGQVVYYTKKGTESLDEQTAFVQTRWGRRRGRWELMAAGKFNWQESRYADRNAQYPGGGLFQNYWQREWYATAGAAWHGEHWQWAYAADYGHNGLNSNLKQDHHAQRQVLQQCLTLRYTLRRLEATARAVAYTDWNRLEGGTAATDARRLSPTLTLGWRVVERTQGRPLQLYVRGFYKELFRVPTFTESYYYHLGSTRLRPELTRQVGAGLTLEAAPAAWCPQLRLTADGYFNRITDRLSAIPYNLYVWQMVNMGRVDAGGLDLTAEGRLEPAPAHALLWAANYSYVRAADRSDPTSKGYGLQPAYMPRHTGAVSLAYENRWVGAVVSVTGTSERWSTNDHTATTRLPGYAEVGCGLYRTFHWAGVRLEARADLTNVFNRQYEVVRRYPMPGRAYRLSLACRW